MKEILVENSKLDSKKEKVNKNWWRYFWITIFILLVVYLIFSFFASSKIENMSKEKQKGIASELIEKVQKQYPEVEKIFSIVPQDYKKEIKKSINSNIEKAYEKLYDNIDNFSKFHYSVTGEYEEIYKAATGKMDKLLDEKIFKPANFSENLDRSLKNINMDTQGVLKEYYSNASDKIKSKLNLNSNETEFLLSTIVQLPKEEMLKIFRDKLFSTLKNFGLAKGVVAGGAFVAKKIILKDSSKIIAKKIVIKAFEKAGIKVATKAGTAAAGAVGGAEAGLLCGPGAVLCSPVGAVIFGIAGWLATDKIEVEVDKLFTEDQFKQELKEAIDEEKEKTKRTLYEIYMISLNKLKNQNIKKLEYIKNHKISEIVNDRI